MLRNKFGRSICFAPDFGAGSGGAPAPAAPPAAAPAAPMASPAPAPAPVASAPAPVASAPAPAASESTFRDQLRKLAQAGVRSMTRRLEAEPGQPDSSYSHLQDRQPETRPLPDNLVAPGAPASAEPAVATAPADQPAAPPVGEQPAASAVQQPPVGSDGPTTPAEDAIKPTVEAVITGFDGKPYKFSHDQLRDIIKGYFHYESQFQPIQQKIEADRAEIAKARQELEAQMKSDDGLILSYLKKSETFKNRVLSLIDDVPDLSESFRQGTQDIALKELEEKVAALEKQRQEEAAAQAEAAKQAQLAQANQARQAVVDNVKARVESLNSNLKLPERTLEALTARALQLVQSGRLPFQADALGQWFQNEMTLEAELRRKDQESVRSEYLRQKQSAPPPPPSNGGTPPLAPQAPSVGRDRIRAVAQRLRSLGAS